MKHLYRALCASLFLFAAPVMGQGTIPIALSQQMNVNGQPMAGALLYTYVVGTVATAQNTFQDTALTIQNPWPLPADQFGRLPMFYLANGSVHVRLTDSAGGPQFDYPNMLVIGASGGSSGGGTVDPTALISTGDLKVKYGTGLLSGFVRLNGLTIGSAVSGATERANADTQNLFIYLYTTDPNLTVSGGRTGNALNDYNANKTIALPDWRGFALAALGDMGNSATSVLTQTYANCLNGATPITLGAACGSQSNTLTLSQLPTGITSAGTVSGNISVSGSSQVTGTVSVSGNVSVSGTVSVSGSTSGTVNVTTNVNNVAFGNVTAWSNGAGAVFRAMDTTGGDGPISSSGVNTLNGSMSGSNSMTGNNTLTGPNTLNGTSSAGGNNSMTGTLTSNNTGGLPSPTVTPEKLATFYIKL